MAAQPASIVPTISPAEMQILISRAGLVLNPGQMADLVLAWRQVAGLIAAIPQGRKLADDMALTFRLPPPVDPGPAARPAANSAARPVSPAAAKGSSKRASQASQAKARPSRSNATASPPKAKAKATPSRATAAAATAKAKAKAKTPSRRPASRRR